MERVRSAAKVEGAEQVCEVKGSRRGRQGQQGSIDATLGHDRQRMGRKKCHFDGCGIFRPGTSVGITPELLQSDNFAEPPQDPESMRIRFRARK